MTEIIISRSDEKATAILRAIRLIDEGAELEPIIRCKDCESLCPCGNNNYICVNWGSWTDLECWCCKGERKNDGK